MGRRATHRIKQLTYRRFSLVLLFGLTVLSWGFPWDQDMVDQAPIKAQEAPTPSDTGAVPINGGETVPAPVTEEGMFAAKEAAAALSNPIPVTPESLQIGADLYEINCRVCHGKGGEGDGLVGLKFATKAPVNLNEAYTQDQTDGEIFFTLTRGRGLMPLYRDALNADERWHVINYLKTELGEQ